MNEPIQSNKKISYVLNVFAILTSIILTGTFLLIDNFNLPKNLIELIKAILPNAIAVLLIYLVVNYWLERKGLSPSQLFNDSLVNGVIKRFPKAKEFLTSNEALKHFDLGEKFSMATELYLVGWSLRGILQKLRPEMVKAICNGTKIKIIVIEPKSKASELLHSHQNDNNLETDLEHFIKVVNRTREDVINKKGKLDKENFEVRFTSWVSSCCLMFYNPNSEKGIVRFQAYPLSVKTNHSKIKTYKIIHRDEDKEVYEYLLDEFLMLWNKDSISEEELNEKLKTGYNKV